MKFLLLTITAIVLLSGCTTSEEVVIGRPTYTFREMCDSVGFKVHFDNLGHPFCTNY